MSSAVILYGMAFLFGISGTTHLVTTDGSPSIASTIASGDSGIRSALIVSMVFLAAGFGFKMAIVPFQMWAPDVYEGAPTPVAAFLSVGSKAAAFAVVIRIFYEGFGPDTFVGDDWKYLFAVLAAITMTVGNVMALRQTNIRRMLGYSSIAQAGNFLVGLAAIAGDIGRQHRSSAPAESCSSWRRTRSRTWAHSSPSWRSQRVRTATRSTTTRGMGRRAPIPAAVLAVCLLSLTGLPPTAGFFAKLYVFNAAVQADLVWLVLIGVLNTVLSAFYYLGVARQMYLTTAEGEPEISTSLVSRGLLVGAAAGVLAFGVYPMPLIDAAQRAVNVFA